MIYRVTIPNKFVIESGCDSKSTSLVIRFEDFISFIKSLIIKEVSP